VLNFTLIGGRQPLHCTTGGLVLLAHASAELQESFLSATLRAYTPRTPTDPRGIRRILAGIRDHGYVICEGYVSPETMGIGMPVRSPDGEVIAALSIVLPRNGARPMSYIPAVMIASRGITRALGQPPKQRQPPPFFPSAEIDFAGQHGQPGERESGVLVIQDQATCVPNPPSTRRTWPVT
jgi:hypothetical protein